MDMSKVVEPRDIHEEVRTRYGELARSVRSPGASESCCGGTTPSDNEISRDHYSEDDIRQIPKEAADASLGCGNPIALADLEPGQVVLDLGSGGGIDVLLSARRVGPTGKAYGLDMTDDMLSLARDNQKKAGVENAEFLKGNIEDVPLPDASVDVIISNCVINLSPDKRKTLQEAFRVLRPGGKLAVSDIVTRGPIPEEIRADMERWTGCLAGALDEEDYRRLLSEAGFESVEVEETRKLSGVGRGCCDSPVEVTEGEFLSAFIRARKPA
jgi:arsenite methyltransferase